jgi:hypothetical protein
MSIILLSYTVLAWFNAARGMSLSFIAANLVDTIGVFIHSELYIPNSIDLFATKAKVKY